MRCAECLREKAAPERGWMTVLSPSGAFRIHYCPKCVAELVRRASILNDALGEDRGEEPDA